MMTNTSKRVRSLASIIGASALVLAGCASAEETPVASTETEDTAAEEVALPEGTLTFANWQWLETGRGETLWEAIETYSEANPGASFVQEATPFGDYATTLSTAMGGGQGPDVFVVLDGQFEIFADAGLLEPLGDVLAGAALNSTNEPLVVDGQQLGVTWEQAEYALLANKNVLEAAGITDMPTTLDELIAAAQQVEDNTDADGFAVRHRIAEFGGWSADFQNWSYGYGGSWSDGTNLTIDSPENIAAVTAFKQMYDSGVMPVGDDASTFRDKFKQNALGFMIDNGGAALSFTAGGAITGTDIISAPLPFPSNGVHQKLILAVNANSENKELAKDFIRWFVTEEAQTLLRPSMGAGTLATDAPLTADFLAANPWAETYVAAGSGSRSPLIIGFELRSQEIHQIILEAVERVITQGQDPAEALGEAQAAAE
jgi:multiple sugar transport system substrate-binding protein